MTRTEIDALWQRALHDAVQAGEPFTRYHFAALVLDAAASRCDGLPAPAACSSIERSLWDVATTSAGDAVRAMKPLTGYIVHTGQFPA
jgi:hypothetical protein